MNPVEFFSWAFSLKGLQGKLLTSGELSDLELIVGTEGTKFKVHRSIVALTSGFLREKIQALATATHERAIEIPDISPESMQMILEFIYTGKWCNEIRDWEKKLGLDIPNCGPWPCENCGRLFNLKSNLGTHRRAHAEEQSYPSAESSKQSESEQRETQDHLQKEGDFGLDNRHLNVAGKPFLAFFATSSGRGERKGE